MGNNQREDSSMSFGDSIRKAMDSDLLDNRDPEALPAGRYKVRIDSASAFSSRAGDDYAKVTHEILEGPVEGRFEHFMGFNSPMQEQINGEALAAYGVDWTRVDSLTDLDLQMVELAGSEADISLSWNDKGFLNINVHGSRTGKSDIPSDANGFETTPEQQATFANAAKNFGDEPAF